MCNRTSIRRILSLALAAVIAAAASNVNAGEDIRVRENPVFDIVPGDAGSEAQWLMRNNTELLRSLVLALENKQVPLRIRQVDDLVFELRLRTQRGDADVDLPDVETPSIRLAFDTGGVSVALNALAGNNNHVYGALGDEAVGVKNLRLGTQDGLPAVRAPSPHHFSTYGHKGHYWQEMEFAYTDGSRMTVRGVSGLGRTRQDALQPNILQARRGYWLLRDAKNENSIRIDIGSGEPLRAAPYVRAFALHTRSRTEWRQPHGLFDVNEPVILDMRFDPDYLEPGKWRIEWSLVDHCQNPAGGGETVIELFDDGPEEYALDLTPDGMGYYRAKVDAA